MNAQNSKGDTALHVATRGNKINLVRLLLEKGVSTDFLNNDGDTALHIAIRGNKRKIILLLLESGTDVNAHFCG